MGCLPLTGDVRCPRTIIAIILDRAEFRARCCAQQYPATAVRLRGGQTKLQPVCIPHPFPFFVAASDAGAIIDLLTPGTSPPTIPFAATSWIRPFR